jgi:hypothetical protein
MTAIKKHYSSQDIKQKNSIAKIKTGNADSAVHGKTNIKITYPTKKELEAVTEQTLKQYHTAIKNLAKR